MADILERNEKLLNHPHIAVGKVVKGFGRGSKELGIPTANFPEDVVEKLPNYVDTGIYFGFACVDNGPVYKMVVSIGWNPFYKNQKKSIETHIMHTFDNDFYDSTLKIIITGYIRPEKNFDSLESLIAAINNDIAEAHKQLDRDVMCKYKDQLEKI